MGNLRPHQKALMLAILVSVVLTFTPYIHALLLPIEYLDTHFHELGHALMGKVLGDDVGNITVYWGGNGDTMIASRHQIAVGTAGYLGAIVIGALTIMLSKSEKGSQIVLKVLSIVLLLSMAFFVRGDVVGLVSGYFWVFALWGLGTLKGDKSIFAAQFIGIQQCIHALQAVFYLFRLPAGTHSDATILESATGIPATVWAVGLATISLVVGGLSLRVAWKHSPTKPMGE